MLAELSRAKAAQSCGTGLVLRFAACHISRMANSRAITIRVPREEAAKLATYAVDNGRTQTDVLRAFIRSLKTRPKREKMENR
jgi:hypothetical protein